MTGWQWVVCPLVVSAQCICCVLNNLRRERRGDTKAGTLCSNSGKQYEQVLEVVETTPDREVPLYLSCVYLRNLEKVVQNNWQDSYELNIFKNRSAGKAETPGVLYTVSTNCRLFFTPTWLV